MTFPKWVWGNLPALWWAHSFHGGLHWRWQPSLLEPLLSLSTSFIASLALVSPPPLSQFHCHGPSQSRCCCPSLLPPLSPLSSCTAEAPSSLFSSSTFTTTTAATAACLESPVQPSFPPAPCSLSVASRFHPPLCCVLRGQLSHPPLSI